MYKTIYSSSVMFILYYCIGSDLYKKRYSNQFIDIVKRASVEELLMVADYYQLGGMLYAELSKIEELKSRISDFKDAFAYQKLKANSIYGLINELSKLKEIKKIQPILLKGTALWDDCYTDIHDRRVTDLDILVPNIVDIPNIVSSIRNIGFYTQSKNWEHTLRDHKKYEISPFIRKKLIKDFDKNYNSFSTSTSIYYNSLKSEEEKRYTYQEIETHKSLFLLSDLKAPSVQDYIVPCIKFKAFRKMHVSAIIVYTAVKFYLDRQLYVEKLRKGAKFYKLLGDLIRLISRASEEDIALSIEISDLWNVPSIYLNVLKNYTFLLPEFEFEF